MSVRPDKDLIEEVATIMEIEPSFVEKDWFVTEIIALLSKVYYEGFVVTFTGGTSLSKAHKVISRFSEDIDYKVEAPKDLQSRAALSSFKKYIVKYLRDNCISIKDEDITAQNSNKSFTIKIDYKTYFKRNKALRPHIKVEMNIGALHLERKSYLFLLL